MMMINFAQVASDICYKLTKVAYIAYMPKMAKVTRYALHCLFFHHWASPAKLCKRVKVKVKVLRTEESLGSEPLLATQGSLSC